MRKGQVEVILTKDGCTDIKVTCPAKIKMHPMTAFITIGFGMPPMQVKPIDWKGVGIAMAGYLVIFLACAFFLASIALGLVAVVAALAGNIIYNRNYFFNYIQKKLREGYQVADQEQQQILTEAGVLPLTENSGSGFKLPLPGNISLDKKRLLPIAGGVVAVVFLLAMCTGGNIVDSALDDVEDIVISMEKYVDKLEAGKISAAEFELEMELLVDEILSLSDYDSYDVQPTSEQIRRAEQLFNRMEKASNQASMMIYY